MGQSGSFLATCGRSSLVLVSFTNPFVDGDLTTLVDSQEVLCRDKETFFDKTRVMIPVF